MRLPIAISIPHAGLHVPEEAAAYCQLTHEQIVLDGDEGADVIYAVQDEVAEFITTDIARAIVDLNRPPNDRGPDGVVKSHTIWNEAIYREPLPEEVIDALLEAYYHPYHIRLDQLTDRGDLLLAVDCHTMAAEAPPIGPNPGSKRPEVCLGNVHGKSFPPEWTLLLQQAFAQQFTGYQVTLNDPFAGGFITRSHGQNFPWIQVEISRAPFMEKSQIRSRVVEALRQSVHNITKLSS